MTNGMPLVVRAAMKPIPTLARPLPSVDLALMAPVPAHRERSDVMAVPAARVVGEAAVAFELANAYLEKFGGDALGDILVALAAYQARLESKGLWRRS
jgi:chorismate synthase